LSTPEGGRIGTSFAEAANYDNTQSLQAKLAGLPAGETTMNLLERPTISDLERLGATLYLLWPPNARELKNVLECCSKNGLSQ